MKKIRIGLPRGLMYHKYHVMWKTFFTKLGCHVIVSPETSKEILNIGINNTIKDSCLPYKIYVGHAIYLSNICDYVLISHVCTNKVCPILKGTYDILKYQIPKEKILDCPISIYQMLYLIRIGFKLTNNPLKVIYSYVCAIKKQQKYNIENENKIRNKLRLEKKKVLIVSEFYSLEDNYITTYIKKYLTESNIIYILSNTIDSKLAKEFSEYFSDFLDLEYSKEEVGAIYYYYQQLDGIIYISINNCPVDSLINTLAIFKTKHLNILNIEIDETIDESQLDKELACFVNTINKKEHV